MQSVSQLLGGQGAPHTLEHGGDTYTVGAVTQRVKSEIERHTQALERSVITQSGASPEVVASALRGLARDVLRGHYSFYGPACIEYLATLDGMGHIARLLVRRGGAELSEQALSDLLSARWEELCHLIQLAIREALPPLMLRALEQHEAGQSAGEQTQGEPDPNAPARQGATGSP